MTKNNEILKTESDKYLASLGTNNTGNAHWVVNVLYGELFKTGLYILINSKESCFSLSLLLKVIVSISFTV